MGKDGISRTHIPFAQGRTVAAPGSNNNFSGLSTDNRRYQLWFGAVCVCVSGISMPTLLKINIQHSFLPHLAYIMNTKSQAHKVTLTFP